MAKKTDFKEVKESEEVLEDGDFEDQDFEDEEEPDTEEEEKEDQEESFD